MQRTDTVWQDPGLTRTFLEGVRGGLLLVEAQVDVFRRLLATCGRPVRRFADLGCGGGFMAAVVLEAFPEASGVALDFSPPMLDAARAALAGHAERLVCAEADLADPGWAAALGDEPCDLIVSGYAIHHLPHERKRALYAEIHDRLAPGGLFLNAEHVASASEWGERLFNEAMVDSLVAHQQRLGRSLPREQVAAEYVYRQDKHANLLLDVETQCTWLRELGYSEVDCWFKVFELALFGGKRSGGDAC